MQYIIIIAIILALLAFLIKSSIRQGWIFILLGIIGFLIFSDLSNYGATGTFFAWLLGLASIAAGIYGMIWKQRYNKQHNNIITDTIPAEISSKTQHGFFFGIKDQNYIIKPENKDGHILIVGGVGSGKSSCLAIPTLRVWRSRALAIDIKGELYNNTKNFRPNIKLFDPRNPNSYGYDPYIFIRKSPQPHAGSPCHSRRPYPSAARNPKCLLD